MRPTMLSVTAIACIVIAIGFLLMTVFGMLQQALALRDPAMRALMTDPLMMAGTCVLGIVGVGELVLLLWSSIAALKLKPAGRTGWKVYVGVTVAHMFLHVVFAYAYSIRKTLEHMSGQFDALPANARQIAEGVVWLSPVCGCVFWMIAPTLIVITLSRRDVQEAFDGLTRKPAGSFEVQGQ